MFDRFQTTNKDEYIIELNVFPKKVCTFNTRTDNYSRTSDIYIVL